MKTPLNGKTWIILAGVLLTALSFSAGWWGRQKEEWGKAALNGERLDRLETWEATHEARVSGPAIERLRLGESALAEHGQRLNAVESRLTEIQTDIREIRRLLERRPVR